MIFTAVCTQVFGYAVYHFWLKSCLQWNVGSPHLESKYCIVDRILSWQEFRLPESRFHQNSISPVWGSIKTLRKSRKGLRWMDYVCVITIFVQPVCSQAAGWSENARDIWLLSCEWCWHHLMLHRTLWITDASHSLDVPILNLLEIS